MHHVLVLTLFAVLTATNIIASDVGISVTPIAVEGFAGRQSFAVGRHGSKVVLIGGRMDGLHRRQPPLAFSADGEPQSIVVLDLEQKKSWSASVAGLSGDVLDQWTSTNACFVQVDSLLYIIGGYGIASSGAGHRTHPVWSSVNVEDLIDAVVAGRPYAQLIAHGTGDAFAITGGRAGFFGDTIITVGGHRFDGRYNPMGGSSFTQAYTNAVRRFIVTGGRQLSFLNESVDPLHLHRRDFNVVPQMFPDGTHGYTAFSGVFRVGVDLPFLDAVSIKRDTHAVVPDFEQYLAHYHCGTVPVFDMRDSSMHTFFLGGIAQYRANGAGALERNDSVPFVNTISRVSRTRNGVMREYRQNETMPGLLGTGAEVVLREQPSLTRNEILTVNASDLTNNAVIGWMIGGIRSTAPNIFWVNDGTQSEASTFVAELRLTSTATSVFIAPSDSQRNVPPGITTRIDQHQLTVIVSDISDEVEIGLFDLNGRYVDLGCTTSVGGSQATMTCSIADLPSGVYIAVVIDGERTASTLLSLQR
jgi:hypothetical protein